MKKKNLLYSLAILALIALIAGVISYATEMRPTQRETQQVPVASSKTPETSTETETATAVKKKACGCCAERIARLQQQIRKARKHRQAIQTAETTGVSQQTP